MPSLGKSTCGCGFGHTRKSAFGKSADEFFFGAPDPGLCSDLGYTRNNVAPYSRFGSAGKTRFGPMTLKKSKN